MEVLSRKIYADTGNSIPKLYMTPKQLCEFEGRSESFFRKIFTELSEQIKLGSRKIYADTGNSIPKLYMTPKQLCEFEGRSESFFRKIFTELSEQIKLGR